MLTIKHWNKLIHEQATICRESSSKSDRDWECEKVEFRKIFLPFLDWCEDEGLFLKSRDFLRKNLKRLEPSLISAEPGYLFFWEAIGCQCDQPTIESLMNAIEKQLE